MPFGLCNAPSTFQGAMNSIFQQFLRKFVLVFFDDVLIYSHNWEDHLGHLRKVMLILRSHQFYIKPSKCDFEKESVEYLGHVISNERVRVDSKKIEAMQSWPQPATLTELRGFLGFTGYYRKFVQDYGIIARPLTAMTKKGLFVWTKEGREAFEKLKQAMTTTPVLALPNFEVLFEVHTDASDVGIGAVLVQKGQPLAFLSKALGVRKVEWSVYVKEMMAVVEAVRVWRPYLVGRKFLIITDQQPLKHLLEQRVATPEQQKFVAKLMGFEFENLYRPGKQNAVADALSRRVDGPLLNAITGPVWDIWERLREVTRNAVELMDIKQRMDGGEQEALDEYEW